MPKFIKLKFNKTEYCGNSIGREIRVEIEALGKNLKIEEKIPWNEGLG
ncbi:MAG: hypothetical protein WCX79_02675 [Candidatus Paceibacterota bacterium]|jgi:hypothetical protein